MNTKEDKDKLTKECLSVDSNFQQILEDAYVLKGQNMILKKLLEQILKIELEERIKC